MTDKDYTQIRIRRDLYARLVKQAGLSKRSATLYLELMLEEWFSES